MLVPALQPPQTLYEIFVLLTPLLKQIRGHLLINRIGNSESQVLIVSIVVLPSLLVGTWMCVNMWGYVFFFWGGGYMCLQVGGGSDGGNMWCPPPPSPPQGA